MSISMKDKKVLDEVRYMLQLLHYSIHTVRTYYHWIKRYMQYHTMTYRKEDNTR
jgi:hypothetical protein